MPFISGKVIAGASAVVIAGAAYTGITYNGHDAIQKLQPTFLS
ncbi:hypothetical protein AAAC51_06340 [Priestia megaterium]